MTLADETGIWNNVLVPALADRVVMPVVSNGLQMPWAVFKRGPLTVGYPRFPVGLESSDTDAASVWEEIRNSMRSLNVDLLRMSAPDEIANAFKPSSIEARLPETVIESLQEWRPEKLPAGMRRKFRYAEKIGLRTEPASAFDGDICHHLYLRTVSRQRGTSRYNAAYFGKLCLASSTDKAVSVTKAMTTDGRVAGFIATLQMGKTAYYLHGGYTDDMAAARPGYFLMRNAIEHARDNGMDRFNMLTSPSAQPELLAYKESFGGTTHMRTYWQEPLGTLGVAAGFALQAAKGLSRLTRRRAE